MEAVVAVQVLRPYVIVVTFADGARREVDIAPYLDGEVFAPLRDEALFRQVAVDPELGTVVWPNGADLAPERLYYGAENPYADYLASRGTTEADDARSALIGAEPRKP